MSNNIVYDTLLTLMPGDRKRSKSGWTGMNGVCCIHNGETPDTRKRLSIAMGDDGISCLVSCFNCNFRAIWKPGQTLSRKMMNFLGWMGLSQEDIKKLNFKVWQERERMKLDSSYQPKEIKHLSFAKKNLPIGARPVMDLLKEGYNDKDFESSVLYLAERGEEIFTGYDYFWTPNREHGLNQRIIIPFRWRGEIVGWTGRATIPTKTRYYSEVQAHYLFNTEVIDNDWQYVFLCEGPFDALAINGVASLGDKLSEEQILWLNQSGKTKVVVPDRINAGGTLVDIAIKQGWHVAFPQWDRNIKDAADAVKAYGKLYSIWTIIDSITKDKLSINVQRQRLK